MKFDKYSTTVCGCSIQRPRQKEATFTISSVGVEPRHSFQQFVWTPSKRPCTNQAKTKIDNISFIYVIFKPKTFFDTEIMPNSQTLFLPITQFLNHGRGEPELFTRFILSFQSAREISSLRCVYIKAGICPAFHCL